MSILPLKDYHNPPSEAHLSPSTPLPSRLVLHWDLLRVLLSSFEIGVVASLETHQKVFIATDRVSLANND